MSCRRISTTYVASNVYIILSFAHLFCQVNAFDNVKLINSTNTYFINYENTKEIAAALKPSSVTANFRIDECYNTNLNITQHEILEFNTLTSRWLNIPYAHNSITVSNGHLSFDKETEIIPTGKITFTFGGAKKTVKQGKIYQETFSNQTSFKVPPSACEVRPGWNLISITFDASAKPNQVILVGNDFLTPEKIEIQAFFNGESVETNVLDIMSSTLKSVQVRVPESVLSDNDGKHNFITLKVRFLNKASYSTLLDGKPTTLNWDCNRIVITQVIAIYKPERKRRQALIIGATALLGSIIGAETESLYHNSATAEAFNAEAKQVSESELANSKTVHDIISSFQKVQINLENESSELSKIEKYVCQSKIQSLESFLENKIMTAFQEF